MARSGKASHLEKAVTKVEALVVVVVKVLIMVVKEITMAIDLQVEDTNSQVKVVRWMSLC